jgi:glycosyltransferase involved in cell wall biosynthesis
VPKVSVTLITRNEAAHIRAALESVAWADERIVVDAESTDETAAIARGIAEQVVVREWPGYGAQKNYAASLASHDWILSLDADERVTPALASQIPQAVASPAYAAYRLPRVTFHMGRWIRSTDWYPDHQLRLYDRRRGSWNAALVHEGIAVEGSTGELTGELEHYPYRDLADHLDTINRYTTLAAAQMHGEGRRAGLAQMAAHPPLAFLRNYVLRGGIRDGVPGLVVSAMNAYYVFLKFAKLRELGA